MSLLRYDLNEKGVFYVSSLKLMYVVLYWKDCFMTPLSPWHKDHFCFLVHPCWADSARKLLMSRWWWPIICITTLERPQEHHKSAFLKKKVTEQATTLTLTASEPCSLTENMMKEGSTGAMSEYLRCELDELVNEDYKHQLAHTQRCYCMVKATGSILVWLPTELNWSWGERCLPGEAWRQAKELRREWLPAFYSPRHSWAS